MRRCLLPSPAVEAAADDDGGRGDVVAPAAATPSRPVTPPLPERVASITGWPLLGVGAMLVTDVIRRRLLALAVVLRSLPALSWGGCWLIPRAASV